MLTDKDKKHISAMTNPQLVELHNACVKLFVSPESYYSSRPPILELVDAEIEARNIVEGDFTDRIITDFKA